MARWRTYTVVGRICDSRADAMRRLKEHVAQLPASDPSETTRWGLVEIRKKAGMLQLPVPRAFLKKLEGLLSDRAVQRTEKGKAALEVLRALGKRR